MTLFCETKYFLTFYMDPDPHSCSKLDPDLDMDPHSLKRLDPDLSSQYR
jgi:hypothetical protein